MTMQTVERFQTRPHPALLGLSRKAGPDLEARAMRAAIRSAVGQDVPLPVVFPDGRRKPKVLGWVRGEPFPSTRVQYTTDRYWCGFASYDSLITALTAGSRFRIDFTKVASTAPTAAFWYDLWPVAGSTTGTYAGSARTAVAFDQTNVGGHWHGGNVSAATKHVVSACVLASGGTPVLTIYDRVLTYEACGFGTSTTQQTMTNGASAGRYNAGAPGLRCQMTGQTVFGGTPTALTELTYTDQGGVGSAVMPTSPTVSIITTAAAPTTALGAKVVAPAVSTTVVNAPFLPLASGDSGLRSIQTYTDTHSSGTGTFCFCLMYPLLSIPTAAANVATMMDTVMQVAALPQLIDGACISMYAYFPAATAATFTGSFDVAWA